MVVDPLAYTHREVDLVVGILNMVDQMVGNLEEVQCHEVDNQEVASHRGHRREVLKGTVGDKATEAGHSMLTLKGIMLTLMGTTEQIE